MIKNDAWVLLSSFNMQICANKKEQFFDTNTSNVTVFRRKQSVLDETGIFINVSIGGADGGQIKTC